MGIQKKLKRGLAALSAVALADPEWTLSNIPVLQALLEPLLHSPLVGEGAAFEAQVAVARSLPGALRRQSIPVAAALRTVQLHQSGALLSSCSRLPFIHLPNLQSDSGSN